MTVSNLFELHKSKNLVLVLCYHNVVSHSDSHSWLSLPLATFTRQMQWLKKRAHFIHPDDFLNGQPLNRKRLNVLVTFDDGFQGVYQNAVPLLKTLEIPALFFVSTRNVLTQEPFWFQSIIEFIQQNNVQKLDLNNCNLGQYFFPAQGLEKRWSEISRLLENIKKIEPLGHESDIDCILAALAETIPHSRVNMTSQTSVTLAQIEELDCSPLFVFGSHAHNHNILTNIDDDCLRNELYLSKRLLAEALEKDIDFIAYPNGNQNRQVIASCERAGYRIGFSIRRTFVQPSTPCFEIPRVMVGGFDSLYSLKFAILRLFLKMKLS